MISVIASIKVKEGLLSEFVNAFKNNVPTVLEEKGCIQYSPTVDIDAGIPVQNLEPNVVTVVEKWNTLDDLKAHLEAAHMLAFRERVKDMVEGVTLKVLEDA